MIESLSSTDSGRQLVSCACIKSPAAIAFEKLTILEPYMSLENTPGSGILKAKLRCKLTKIIKKASSWEENMAIIVGKLLIIIFTSTWHHSLKVLRVFRMSTLQTTLIVKTVKTN